MQKPSLELYAAARNKQGAPLSHLASDQILREVKKGDRVAITTGAGHCETLPNGETDGPLGAAAIARILSYGLGAVPIIVSESEYLGPIAASCEALGLRRDDGQRYLTEAFPRGAEDGKRKAASIVQTHSPSLVITIERLGPNSKGFIHSLGGLDWGEHHARLEHLILEAQSSKIPTLGVGDGGNELGCGLIVDDVRKFAWYGAKCKCPCGGGVATVISTDVLVTGATSNWGSYAIEAALAARLGDSSLMHDASMEEAILCACVVAGGRDGPTGTATLAVDGSGIELQQNYVRTLTFLVKGFLET